jgi:carboxymethylenebutenolidase
MTERWNAEATTVAPETAPALTQAEIDRRVFDLYDEYCHGHIDRREFLQRASLLTVGGLAMAQALLPRYALAQTISFTDQRIKARYVTYPSPGGNSGTMRGYLVQPSGAGPFPTVLVIHENRGLNDHIRRVVGRFAATGWSALAIDLLSEEGGTAALGDEGQATAALNQAPPERFVADMRAGLSELARRVPGKKLAMTGFCFGGGMVWLLLASGEPRLAAAVPFYGPLPDGADFSGSKAAVLAI